MKLRITYTKKITAVFAAIMLIFLALIGLISSGCSYTIDYDYIKYDGEEGYYVVRAGGYLNSLKGTLEIPATYGEGDKEAPVKEIAGEGFRGCAITKLIIPASINKIGIAAFANCSQLKEVEFKEGSVLTEIPQGSFGYDISLTKIHIPDTVESIGHYAFLECNNLETVNLPKNLKRIMGRAFEDCYTLSHITFPEGLESIGYLAFYNSALTEVIIPDSVRDTQISATDEDGNAKTETLFGLGYGAFHTCRSLKKLVIGSGITVLKSGVFGYCDNLEEIYIPSSVKQIEGAYLSGDTILYGHAFHNCTSLKIINYAGTEEEWNQIDIDNEVPNGSGATYNNDALFKDKNNKLTIFCGKSYTPSV